MFKKESRAFKPDKATREWLVLLATLILCALFISNFLYTLFTFKSIRSEHKKFTDHRQFVSVDVGTTVNKDAIYEVKQDESTMVDKYVNDTVEKDTSYEIQQDENTAINKNASYETKQDASNALNNDSSYEINQDASNEIKEDTSTEFNNVTSTEFNNDTRNEINQDTSTKVDKDMSTKVDKDTSSEIKQDASTKNVMDAVYKDDDHTQSLQYLLTRLIGDENRTRIDSIGFGCDTIEGTTECVTNKPVIINTTTMQVDIQLSPDTNTTNTVIRPYPQYPNGDITPVTITTTKPTQPPTCDYNHQHPALIFSTGGFTGNYFHDFDGLIIPLFITTRLFKSRLQFLIVDHRPPFFHKFRRIIQSLTDHEIINTATNSSIHCFPAGAIINLKFHTALGIKSYQPPHNYYSMLDFRQFLRQIYGLKTKSISETQNPPKLLLISRQGSRKFLNEEEMVKMMEELGFEVIVGRSAEEMSNLEEYSPVINSCSVMVGTHGAGMTNEVFLPDGAVVVVVRPLGFQDGLDVFSWPAPDMGLKYLEYKMRPEESSLVDEYGLDHPVLQNTSSITSKGWMAMAEIYLAKQDFRIDVNRFKETVAEAMKLIKSP